MSSGRRAIMGTTPDDQWRNGTPNIQPSVFARGFCSLVVQQL